MITQPPSAPDDEEQEALAILRKHSGDALKRMAQIAEESGKLGELARQTLEKSLLRLKEIIDDPASPADLKQVAIETRRKFLAS